ncbi:hypothetical protein [Catenuloplanes niger]
MRYAVEVAHTVTAYPAAATRVEPVYRGHGPRRRPDYPGPATPVRDLVMAVGQTTARPTWSRRRVRGGRARCRVASGSGPRGRRSGPGRA